MTNDEFQQWLVERNKAVAGTLEEFTEYSIRMGKTASDPKVYEIMYHKCRTAITSLPTDVRQTSHSWLLDNSYESWA